MSELRTEEEIILSWKGDLNKPMVSVCCLTYNHEKYIEEAIRGILIQETNFPFEIIVHDDASTDKTKEIIKVFCKSYPRLFRPIFQEVNQYSKGINPGFEYLLPAAKGKYVAICEGDDYWIDRRKLQDQFMILEENKQYSACIHNAFLYYCRSSEHRKFNLKNLPSILTVCDVLLRGWFAPTASFFYRNTHLQEPPKNINGDSALLFQLAIKGNIFYINDVMSVYRYQSIGSLSSALPQNGESGLYKKRLEFFDYVDQYSRNKYLFFTLLGRMKILILLRLLRVKFFLKKLRLTFGL